MLTTVQCVSGVSRRAVEQQQAGLYGSASYFDRERGNMLLLTLLVVHTGPLVQSDGLAVPCVAPSSQRCHLHRLTRSLSLGLSSRPGAPKDVVISLHDGVCNCVQKATSSDCAGHRQRAKHHPVRSASNYD